MQICNDVSISCASQIKVGLFTFYQYIDIRNWFDDTS